MKVIKTIVFSGILVIGISATAFASWWNPVTWRIFKKENKVVIQEGANIITVSTTTFNELKKDSLFFCNGSRYKKCLEGQSLVCPTNGEDAFCQKNKTEEIKTPKTKVDNSLPGKVQQKIENRVAYDNKEKSTLTTPLDTNYYNSQMLKVIDSGIESANADIKVYSDLSEEVKIRINTEQNLLDSITPYYDSSKSEGENVVNDILKKTIYLLSKEIEYLKGKIVVNNEYATFAQPLLNHFNKQKEYLHNNKIDKKYLDENSLDIQKALKSQNEHTLARISEYNKFINDVEIFKSKKQSDINWLINDARNDSLKTENDKLKSEATYKFIDEQIKKSSSNSGTYYCESNYLGVQGAYSISCH